jgi:HD-GYP domain-containing protein (c-di-GMP phosphodiesterase class II)
VNLIRKASLLHDLGKLGIPDEILRKPSALTKEEFEVVMSHPSLGAEILAASQALQSLIPIVRHHHERYDGKGYPDQVKGENVPIEARVLALADAVEAMASDRPYRSALDYESIVREVKINSGTQFDPKVARAFLEILHDEGEAFLVNSAARAEDSLEHVLPVQLVRKLRPNKPLHPRNNVALG